jgi:hypothetical protein
MIAAAGQFRDWDVALMILVLTIAMVVPDVRRYVWHKRYFSPERKRIEDVGRWWQERAR